MANFILLTKRGLLLNLELTIETLLSFANFLKDLK